LNIFFLFFKLRNNRLLVEVIFTKFITKYCREPAKKLSVEVDRELKNCDVRHYLGKSGTGTDGPVETTIMFVVQTALSLGKGAIYRLSYMRVITRKVKFFWSWIILLHFICHAQSSETMLLKFLAHLQFCNLLLSINPCLPLLILSL